MIACRHTCPSRQLHLNVVDPALLREHRGEKAGRGDSTAKGPRGPQDGAPPLLKGGHVVLGGGLSQGDQGA